MPIRFGVKKKKEREAIQDEMEDNKSQLRYLLHEEKGMGTRAYKISGQMSSTSISDVAF